MEPVLTCFHYNYPQSIAFLIKITNNEILLKIIPHGWYPCPLILKQSFTAYWVLCLFLSLPISQSRKVGRQTDKGKKKVMESRGKSQHSAWGQGTALWPGPGHLLIESLYFLLAAELEGLVVGGGGWSSVRSGWSPQTKLSGPTAC